MVGWATTDQSTRAKSDLEVRQLGHVRPRLVSGRAKQLENAPQLIIRVAAREQWPTRIRQFCNRIVWFSISIAWISIDCNRNSIDFECVPRHPLRRISNRRACDKSIVFQCFWICGAGFPSMTFDLADRFPVHAPGSSGPRPSRRALN